MAPTSTPTLVQIFVRSPEDDLRRFINENFATVGGSFSSVHVGRLAHPRIAIIAFISIFGLCIYGTVYWCREGRRKVRLLSMA